MCRRISGSLSQCTVPSQITAVALWCTAAFEQYNADKGEDRAAHLQEGQDVPGGPSHVARPLKKGGAPVASPKQQRQVERRCGLRGTSITYLEEARLAWEPSRGAAASLLQCVADLQPPPAVAAAEQRLRHLATVG